MEFRWITVITIVFKDEFWRGTLDYRSTASKTKVRRAIVGDCQQVIIEDNTSNFRLWIRRRYVKQNRHGLLLTPTNCVHVAQALIESAAEVSIARQISISRSQRHLLRPITPRSERLVDRKPLTPTLVELSHRKSERVILEQVWMMSVTKDCEGFRIYDCPYGSELSIMGWWVRHSIIFFTFIIFSPCLWDSFQLLFVFDVLW